MAEFLIYPDVVRTLRNAGCTVYHDGARGRIVAEHGTHRRYFRREPAGGMFSHSEIRAFLDFLHAQPRRD